ncbi:MAG: tetratricopeptide repeat protein [bacterium]|nr:tetratricopeptide repeat protein [bacterium]
MSKGVAILGLALIAAAPAAAFAASDHAGSALPDSAQVSEVGLPDGRLASAALSSGQFARAATRLTVVRPDAANDPARLINLGNAYVGLGRIADARAAYMAARYAPDAMLVLADGSEASSRDVARRAMGRIEASYAMR